MTDLKSKRDALAAELAAIDKQIAEEGVVGKCWRIDNWDCEGSAIAMRVGNDLELIARTDEYGPILEYYPFTESIDRKEIPRADFEREALPRFAAIYEAAFGRKMPDADAIEKLAGFKAYVHRRLDEAGIPADPDSPHKAEGCRIGGRLDIVLGRRCSLDDDGAYKRGYVAAMDDAARKEIETSVTPDPVAEAAKALAEAYATSRSLASSQDQHTMRLSAVSDALDAYRAAKAAAAKQTTDAPTPIPAPPAASVEPAVADEATKAAEEFVEFCGGSDNLIRLRPPDGKPPHLVIPAGVRKHLAEEVRCDVAALLRSHTAKAEARGREAGLKEAEEICREMMSYNRQSDHRDNVLVADISECLLGKIAARRDTLGGDAGK